MENNKFESLVNNLSIPSCCKEVLLSYSESSPETFVEEFWNNKFFNHTTLPYGGLIGDLWNGFCELADIKKCSTESIKKFEKRVFERICSKDIKWNVNFPEEKNLILLKELGFYDFIKEYFFDGGRIYGKNNYKFIADNREYIISYMKLYKLDKNNVDNLKKIVNKYYADYRDYNIFYLKDAMDQISGNLQKYE